MRGLLKAASVLAPVLTSALVLPDRIALNSEWDDRPLGSAVSFALIKETSTEPTAPVNWDADVLALRLDVLSSEEPCGYGNVTVDGQTLPQVLDDGVLIGRGSITTELKSVILASWSFRCIKVNDQPNSQHLKFIVDSVDGKALRNVGFSAVFRQTEPTIVTLNTNLAIPDRITTNHNPEDLLPLGQDKGSPNHGLEHDMAELDWMYGQLYELNLMISEKQQAIAEHAYEHSEDFGEEIKDCDSLKCVMNAVVHKLKHTAQQVYGKIAGQGELYEDEAGHFPKLPFKKPDEGKPGNHTHPPPPHWRKHKFLPICRPPPHHAPPHRGEYPPPPFHHGPPHGEHPPQPPPHSKPPGDEYPPPPFHHGPPHGEHPPPPPPPPHHDQDPLQNSGLEGPPTAHEHFPPPPPPGHRRPHRRAFQVIKYTSICFLLALLLITLHRRACTPAKRADRKARREQRRRLRAYRRAANKYTVARFFSRMSGNATDEEPVDDYEEKQSQFAEDSSSEDDMSTTMTDEIAQFRNAASVVDDIVSAEEGRARTVAYAHGHFPHPIPIPGRDQGALTRGFDIGSQLGDGEELPAYEDHDGSEMSSVVADGFRYTPGNSNYSPEHSTSGSASDILGPDTKN